MVITSLKYMRTYHPDKPVYYIIEKDSKEAENVLPSEMSYSIIQRNISKL